MITIGSRFQAALAAESLKLRTRPAVWVLGGAWLAVSLFFGYVLPYVGYRTGAAIGPGPQALAGLDRVLPDAFVTTAINGTPLFGGAVMLVLGALVTGGEYGHGTWKTVLTQWPRRSTTLLAQAVGIAAVVGLVLAAGFALSAGTSALIAATESASGSFPPVGEMLRGYGVGYLVLLTWAMLGALGGIVLRNTAMAVGLGLVWALVVEGLIRASAGLLDAVDVAQRALPGVNAGSLVASLSPNSVTPGVTAVVGPGQALVVLAIYLVGSVAIALTLFTRRDVS